MIIRHARSVQNWGLFLIVVGWPVLTRFIKIESVILILMKMLIIAAAGHVALRFLHFRLL